MALNRLAEPEAVKRAELIQAARQLFISDGYDATQMIKIAVSAGVEPNAIYWYFADKDALLLAVLNEVLVEGLKEHEAHEHLTSIEQLVWLVENLRHISQLVSVVHNRLTLSPPLREWHDRFHALLEGLIAARMMADSQLTDVAIEARIAAYTIEGLISHGDDPQTIQRACVALAKYCAA